MNYAACVYRRYFLLLLYTPIVENLLVYVFEGVGSVITLPVVDVA